jgi:cytochrome c biogenesis protein CcmG, thiol:disulfide interchange protein DsbE
VVFPRFAAFGLISFLLISICISGCSRSNETGLNPGDYPPKIEISTLDGKPFKFEQIQGKVVLLNFWASWCAPCIEELPSLQRLHDALKDKNFTVIGIGIDDTKDALIEFQKKFSLTFPLLIDNDGLVKNRYKVSGVPESFIIGADGKLTLFLDPSDNNPLVRIVGPRAWDSSVMLSRIGSLLP